MKDDRRDEPQHLDPTWDAGPTEAGDDPGDDLTWEDRVELESGKSTVSADADLDPILGYDPNDIDEIPERKSKTWWWFLLVVIALATIGLWWFGRDRETQPAPAGEASVRTESARQEVAQIELPPLNASDAFVRRLVGEIAAHPALTRWLANDDLVRRFVGAVEVVAEGQVPRDALGFMAPDQGYQAEAAGPDLWRTSAASHQRFSDLLSVMQLVEPADAARIVGTVIPLADEARRDLGYPDGQFRAALDRAVAQLVRVSPQLASEPLVREGEIYLYEDTNVEEDLTPAQKALLRLGPEQTAWVQAWLRRFHDALTARAG